VFELTSILENANTNQQPPTTANPITTITTSHLNHKSERKNQQKPTSHHSPSNHHHPQQPLSHPRNPDHEGTKNPLTLSDSKLEILAVAFVAFKTRSNQRAAVIRLTSGLSRRLLQWQNRPKSNGGATRMEVKGGEGC